MRERGGGGGGAEEGQGLLTSLMKHPLQKKQYETALIKHPQGFNY